MQADSVSDDIVKYAEDTYTLLNKFIDEFESLIIAHVRHNSAISPFCDCSTFMFESAEGGSFNGIR